jgi:integrase
MLMERLSSETHRRCKSQAGGEIVARQSLQYELITLALRDITDGHTVRSYKRSVKKFVDWAKVSGYGTRKKIEGLDVPPRPSKQYGKKPQVLLTKNQVSAICVIQAYTNYLKAEHYSAGTIHTYIAPLCKAFGFSENEIRKPKRASGTIVRSRLKPKEGGTPTVNVQGFQEEHQERFARLVAGQKAIGIRRSELRRLKGRNLKEIGGELFVEVERGKGGKYQLQRISKEQEPVVRELFRGIDANQSVFTERELKNKIDLHHMRADVARRAYAEYLEKIQSIPGYREQLIEELKQRWQEAHPNQKRTREENSRQFQQFISDMTNESPYCLRGDNRIRAVAHGWPIEYDRLALMAVSVYHLSHWRLGVTVTNYLVY